MASQGSTSDWGKGKWEVQPLGPELMGDLEDGTSKHPPRECHARMPQRWTAEILTGPISKPHFQMNGNWIAWAAVFGSFSASVYTSWKLSEPNI